MRLTRANKASWFEQLWLALHEYRREVIQEGDPDYDEEWDALCTVMAWLEEEVGYERT